MKYAFISFLYVGTFLFGCCSLPSISLAQTSSTVLVSQGVQNIVNSFFPSSGTRSMQYDYYIGTGLNGTSTGAFLSGEAHFNTSSLSYHPFGIEIFKSSTSAYTDDLGSCTYFSPLQQDYSAGFQQLNFDSCTLSDTQAFDPSSYYQIRVEYAYDSSQFISFVYYGAASTTKYTVINTGGTVDPIYPNFAPQFALVANGFQITPTTGSSGLFLSGAQSYCNNQFGTSTGGLFGLGTDLANGICQAVGYLFIPTPDSIQAFTAIPTSLGNTPPLSWFGQIKDRIQAQDASSTDNFINLTINFGTTTKVLGFTSLNVISTSTISKYLDDSTRNSMRNLISVVFYLATASFLYFEIKKIWQTA